MTNEQPITSRLWQTHDYINTNRRTTRKHLSLLPARTESNLAIRRLFNHQLFPSIQFIPTDIMFRLLMLLGLFAGAICGSVAPSLQPLRKFHSVRISLASASHPPPASPILLHLHSAILPQSWPSSDPVYWPITSNHRIISSKIVGPVASSPNPTMEEYRNIRCPSPGIPASGPI